MLKLAPTGDIIFSQVQQRLRQHVAAEIGAPGLFSAMAAPPDRSIYLAGDPRKPSLREGKCLTTSANPSTLKNVGRGRTRLAFARVI